VLSDTTTASTNAPPRSPLVEAVPWPMHPGDNPLGSGVIHPVAIRVLTGFLVFGPLRTVNVMDLASLPALLS